MDHLALLTSDLPDAESARRFVAALEAQHPRDSAKLQENDGLLSDVLTLAAYSPLLSTTLLQNPEYLWWLNRKRRAPAVRTKDELLEGLGRFILTHTDLDLHTQLARFRRRELLRIFLSDIRRLATIAEVTEDISNLADSILETALSSARQEMDNRFGQPQTVDEKGKKTTAEFAIVSLGKLGSRELNYSSDIDLLFLYSGEGQTSGRGTRGAITNREYFVKLGETITQLVGKQTGEGPAYRVDMRLRPHGRVGPLAISVPDAVRYYTSEARDWERQVLIRSRASAGDAKLYGDFFEQVEGAVFQSPNRREGETGSAFDDPKSAIRAALDSVRRSKELIDLEQKTERGLNVKLGRGGIREIEFIAQALQLAYGGGDQWLRAPHTLISLARLSDRGLITESELTELFKSYDFLRRVEHILQMENGLQTHSVPNDTSRRLTLARRMRFDDVEAFDRELGSHTQKVHSVFARVFEQDASSETAVRSSEAVVALPTDKEHKPLPTADNQPISQTREAYFNDLNEAIQIASDFRHRLGSLRRRWSELVEQIRKRDLERQVDIRTAKRSQTSLAEASIDVAIDIARAELSSRYSAKIEKLSLAVMGLGKLGGGGVDYGSDLDLVLIYDHSKSAPPGVTPAEFYSRAAEIIVTTLSSITRDGHLYRVDLRLRPYGKNGTSTIAVGAFAEYMRVTASVWEWLAFVKLRAVAGDLDLANSIERETREIVYARASSATTAELASETRRMRFLLEKKKAGPRTKDIDIKYGPGGMLDVYFAMRFLQLRDGIPDSPADRSTSFVLKLLRDSGSLLESDFKALLTGYQFLSVLDHELRLVVGRTTRLPIANTKALDAVAERMNVESATSLVEQLTVHRLGIRAAFEGLVRV